MRAWAAALVGLLILGVVGCSTTPVVTGDPPRLEGVTPPPTQPAPQPSPLLGRWYGTGRAEGLNWSTLDIRGSGDGLRWTWDSPRTTDYVRASGTGSVAGDQVSLVGPHYAFTLKWDGATLRGTMTGSGYVSVAVEFKRSRPPIRAL